MPKSVERSNETYNAVMGAYKAMRSNVAAELSREGLTPSQFSVLRALARQRAVQMNRISQEMLVTPPNITGLIDRLESKKLVRRAASEEDRRAIAIELTPEGKRLQARVAKRYNDFMRDVLREFTSEEQKTLRTLLTKLEEQILLRRRKKD
jgi:DNA-binding MarR family transcriptional regulator